LTYAFLSPSSFLVCIELGEAARPVDWKNNPVVAAFVTFVVFAGGRFSEFRFSAGSLSSYEHAG
jgi:hypothetical protein